MLQELEASKEELGVGSYGLAVTTLEEVFLAVSAQAAAEAAKSGNGGDPAGWQVALDVGAAKGGDQGGPEAEGGGRGLKGAAAGRRDVALTKVLLLIIVCDAGHPLAGRACCSSRPSMDAVVPDLRVCSLHRAGMGPWDCLSWALACLTMRCCEAE